jgi:broad specificity phosphatase PhoE
VRRLRVVADLYTRAVAVLRFLTHPQVRVSVDVPVPRWGLSDVGRTRAEGLLTQPWLGSVGRLVSSAETKALETAAVVAAATGLPIEVREALHENDRSSTGFVPPDRFEVLADAFFAHPDASVDGWETAASAQRRIIDATADLLDPPAASRDVLIVGHGATGTLLLCYLIGRSISRTEDQCGGEAAPGGGNYWSYDTARKTMLHRWRPIDVAEN